MKLSYLIEAQFGNWEADYNIDTIDIFPQMANGETIKVTHAKAIITCKHIPTGDSFKFIITKRGNHYDSRDIKKPKGAGYWGTEEPDKPKTEEEMRGLKPVSQFEVINELDRLLGAPNGRALYAAAVRSLRVYTAPSTHQKTSSGARPRPASPDKPEWLKKRITDRHPKGGVVTTVYINPATAPPTLETVFMKGPIPTESQPELAKLLGVNSEWFMVMAG